MAVLAAWDAQTLAALFAVIAAVAVPLTPFLRIGRGRVVSRVVSKLGRPAVRAED